MAPNRLSLPRIAEIRGDPGTTWPSSLTMKWTVTIVAGSPSGASSTSHAISWGGAVDTTRGGASRSVEAHATSKRTAGTAA
jgi:hypothetical protein